MKRWMMAMVMAGLMVAGVGLISARAESMHDEAMEKSGATQQITGEVLDLACYLGHGAQGDSHAQCGQKCIESGLPVGIKSGNTIYLAIGAEHGTANAELAPLAGKQVTAEGVVTERDEMHVIAIKKVTVKK